MQVLIHHPGACVTSDLHNPFQDYHVIFGTSGKRVDVLVFNSQNRGLHDRLRLGPSLSDVTLQCLSSKMHLDVGLSLPVIVVVLVCL